MSTVQGEYDILEVEEHAIADGKINVDQYFDLIEVEEEALRGELEEGFYILDVSDLENCIGSCERYVNGNRAESFEVPHDDEEITSLLYVQEDGRFGDARSKMEELLEEYEASRENVEEDDWLYGPEEEERIAMARFKGNTILRACHVE